MITAHIKLLEPVNTDDKTFGSLVPARLSQQFDIMHERHHATPRLLFDYWQAKQAPSK